MMEDIDRLKISQNSDLLAQLIDMNILLPKLISYHIFNNDYPEISEWINNLNDNEIKKNILLEIMKRGPHAYQNLIRSLEETNHHECVHMLSASTHLTYDPLSADEPLKIKVRRSTNFCDVLNNPNPINIYPMKSKPRGVVLMILLYDVNNNEISRKSAEHDEENLTNLFKQMGFKIYVEKNLTNTTEVLQKVKEFSKKSELRRVDCAFFILVGDNAQDNDNVSISLKNTNDRNNYQSDNEIGYGQFIDFFSGQNCPNLINKPKAFIFHCGNSNRVYDNFVINHGNNDTTAEFNLRVTTDRIVRNYSDILISFSIIKNKAFGMTKNGFLFIQVLCEVFMKYAYNTHLSDLFKIVNARTKSLITNHKDIPSFIKTISFNHCYINPGMFENDI